MYKLKESYGRAAYLEWTDRLEKAERQSPADRNRTLHPRLPQYPPVRAASEPWPVASYRELAEAVSFLTSMNKRLVLFYRGQSRDEPMYPMLFRDGWTLKIGEDPKRSFAIEPHRQWYWNELLRIGVQVYDVCNRLGLPRWRGVRDTREVQWAVIQHYGLWPTPMIDLTSSLRIAASFALAATERDGRPAEQPATAYLSVVGLPNSTGSITFDIDQQLCLARLASAVPSTAKCPHLQDGFLVGRFPFYDVATVKRHKTDLGRRLVARFRLDNGPAFWDDEFKIVGKDSLYPQDDPLARAFAEQFGAASPTSLAARAEAPEEPV